MGFFEAIGALLGIIIDEVLTDDDSRPTDSDEGILRSRAEQR